MTKVLITGTHSFVGNNFRKYSKFSDIEEISLFENKPEEIEFDRFDVVLHLAAIVHQSKDTPESEYFRVNRDLCLRVAEQSKKSGIKHFIFLSTVKVYGEHYTGTWLRNENSNCNPEDAYGKSKLEAEKGLKKLEDSEFRVSIIRTPLVYGEGVKANMLSLTKLVDILPLLPLGNLKNKRNFTFAGNLVGYIDRIIEKNASGTFIAMDENAISTSELLSMISKYLGKRTVLFRLPSLFVKIAGLVYPEIIERLYGSLEFENLKTKAALSYRPPFTTEEGIKKMVLYYLENKRKERHSY